MPGVEPQAPVAEAPVEQAAPQEGGGAKELVTNIQGNMSQLVQGLEGSNMQAEAQKFSQIMQAFQAAVEELGQPAQQAPADQSVTTPEAGGQDVQPVA